MWHEKFKGLGVGAGSSEYVPGVPYILIETKSLEELLKRALL